MVHGHRQVRHQQHRPGLPQRQQAGDASSINGGKNMLLMFNYRPQGTNNTESLRQGPRRQLQRVPVQDSTGKVADAGRRSCTRTTTTATCTSRARARRASYTDAAGSTNIDLLGRLQRQRPGRRLGQRHQRHVACNAGAAFQITKNFDVVGRAAGRAHARPLHVSDADPNTAICTWTAGNNQPQRDGTWIGAIDVDHRRQG